MMFNLDKIKHIDNIKGYNYKDIIDITFDCSCGNVLSNINQINHSKHFQSFECKCGFKIFINWDYSKYIYYIKTYNKNDQLHNNLPSPAYIMYSKTGNIKHVMYYNNGYLHNPFGYAVINYSDLGFYYDCIVFGRHVELGEYYVNGKRHNSFGLSIFNGFSSNKTSFFYLNGSYIDKNEFIKRLEKKYFLDIEER